MNNSNKDCGPLCRNSVPFKSHEILAVYEKMTQDKNIKTVSEEDYLRRVHICKECDCLLFGNTCRHCGCLVEVTARRADSSCPYPYNPKW